MPSNERHEATEKKERSLASKCAGCSLPRLEQSPIMLQIQRQHSRWLYMHAQVPLPGPPISSKRSISAPTFPIYRLSIFFFCSTLRIGDLGALLLPALRGDRGGVSELSWVRLKGDCDNFAVSSDPAVEASEAIDEDDVDSLMFANELSETSESARLNEDALLPDDEGRGGVGVAGDAVLSDPKNL
jgi:hypothetical protein